MFQNPSAGIVDHPVNTSDCAQYNPDLNETTDTTEAALQVTAAKMNLESSTSQILDNVSSQDQQELKAPNNPSQSDPALNNNLAVDNESKSIIGTATTGGDVGTVNGENASSGRANR